MILVWILLASAFALALALASAAHFLVCRISCESVVGFLANFHGYVIGA